MQDGRERNPAPVLVVAGIGRGRKLAENGACKKVVDLTVARNRGGLAGNDVAPDVVTAARAVKYASLIA